METILDQKDVSGFTRISAVDNKFLLPSIDASLRLKGHYRKIGISQIDAEGLV